MGIRVANCRSCGKEVVASSIKNGKCLYCRSEEAYRLSSEAVSSSNPAVGTKKKVVSVPESIESKDEQTPLHAEKIQKSQDPVSADQKNFLVKLVSVAVVLAVLYFVVSPYQNCLRDYSGVIFKDRFCTEKTSW